MAKSTNQKSKLLYLMRLFLEKTDENHGVTMADMVDYLQANDIKAERKCIYSDLEVLRTYGMDIISEKANRTVYYRLASRDFELAELKLLVDSVQAAKFITAKKTNELIKKLEGLASRYEASLLQRQVYVSERNKTMNESIYYNVDQIHNAIGKNVQITFQYFQWDIHKQMILKRDGELYQVSPWALTWDDENYYLVAYDKRDRKIKHFRVDKMLKISLLDEMREGKHEFKESDMAGYAKKLFGMFGGEEQRVRLLCHNSLAGVMIDRFGQDIAMVKADEEHFTLSVKVVVSRQFLTWVMSLGDGVTIVSPEKVVERMREEVERLTGQYAKKS